MNKKLLYITAIIAFAAVVIFIVFKYKNDEARKEAMVYELQDRKGLSAQTQEWEAVRKTSSALHQAIAKNPGDTKSSLALAALFIQEARITGNYAYYDVAAMKHINDVLQKEPENFNALVYKSLIFLSQHHFAEGLATAQKAQHINPYNAFVYGILVDGHVEMGDYRAAVENADKMVSIRPDLRSYSRVSYLREIYGDYPGAVEAMKMAVQAGAPGDEATEWSRVQLGRLYENTGELKYAEMHYTIALDERPGYAYALAGLARIALAAKEYDKAIAYYQRADSMINDYSFKEELVDVYVSAGHTDKAAATSEVVIKEMNKNVKPKNSDDSTGHYSDRELAFAYLRVNDFDKALMHALQEYNRRPENIDVNETVAWVYYLKGEYDKAMPYLKAALKTNSKNPTLLCRAGLIYAKAGEKKKAVSAFSDALTKNPNISERLKTESINVYKILQQSV